MSFIPTSEQVNIFEKAKSGEDLVVVARAGCGKSTSLLELKKKCDLQALYVVYNTANRKEAEAKFPKHVKPVTGHSLAYKPIIGGNRDYRKKFTDARQGCRIHPQSVIEAANISSIYGVKPHVIAGLVMRTIGKFQVSADDKLSRHHFAEDAMPKRFCKPNLEGQKIEIQNLTFQYAKLIWNKMSKSSDPFPILHDTYLKLFQLSDPNLRVPQILCDEFQDTNPVVSDIIEKQDSQMILVGDPQQQIYSWRGAINALENRINSGTPVAHLSTSFRFGPQIAGLANILLKSLDEQVLLRGNGPDISSFSHGSKHTVIARNNITLFEHAIDSVEKKLPFTIVGGSQDLIKLVESGYALYKGEMYNIKDPDLKGYQNWDEFKEVTEILSDSGMKRLVSVIEKYEGEALEFVGKLKDAENTNEKDAHLILTTAHKSKGREWQQVRLCDDLALGEDSLEKLTNKSELSQEEKEQINLLYVAATRGRKAVELDTEVKQELRVIHQSNRTHAHAMSEEKCDECHQIKRETPSF